MARRRRFAHGSSTGAQELQCAAARASDAHRQLREAAQRVAADLDGPSAGIPIACSDDGSMVLAIEQAQRSVSRS